MDNVVVIGGSGFLGSHVADELSVRGYKGRFSIKRPLIGLEELNLELDAD